MILLVEDNGLQRETTETLLRSRGYTVRSQETAERAIAEIDQCPPRVLVLDLMLMGDSGNSVLDKVASIPPMQRPVVVVTTALPDPLPEFPVPVSVLRKPFDAEDLVREISQLAPLEGTQS
jgi:CheY-like chemotaxis protein